MTAQKAKMKGNKGPTGQNQRKCMSKKPNERKYRPKMKPQKAKKQKNKDPKGQNEAPKGQQARK